MVRRVLRWLGVLAEQGVLTVFPATAARPLPALQSQSQVQRYLSSRRRTHTRPRAYPPRHSVTARGSPLKLPLKLPLLRPRPRNRLLLPLSSPHRLPRLPLHRLSQSPKLPRRLKLLCVLPRVLPRVLSPPLLPRLLSPLVLSPHVLLLLSHLPVLAATHLPVHAIGICASAAAVAVAVSVAAAESRQRSSGGSGVAAAAAAPPHHLKPCSTRSRPEARCDRGLKHSRQIEA